MFANNEKISVRQLDKLLCLDWTAKLCLLLPVLLREVQGWNQIMALFLGTVLTCLYAWILGSLSGKVGESFTKYMGERLGKAAAWTAGLLFFFYLLLNQVYLARAAGRICGLFLLPEMKEVIIGILFLLAGLATAVGSIQKRARAAQFLYPVVAAMLLIMIVASAGSVKLWNLRWNGSLDAEGVLNKSVCVFAAFSGVGLVLYEAPYINIGQNRGVCIRHSLIKSVLFTSVFMAAIFVIMLGAFGKSELSALPWPVLVLMSNVNIPGGFLQRWDIIFLSVLLLGLLTASGTGIYYMDRILGELFPRIKKNILPWYVTGISAAAMVIAGSYELAERLYAKWVLCAIMPLISALPVLLWVVERVNAGHDKKREEMEP